MADASDTNPSITITAMDRLADSVREEYRAIFALAVAEGRARPLVLPISLLGPFIAPTLWLAIPHSRGRWMGLAQWLVVVFVLAFNLDLMWRTSSANIAFAYAVGLMAFWGIISTLNILVWTTPQVDAARIFRRVKGADPKAIANGHIQEDEKIHKNGPRQPEQDQSPKQSSQAKGGDVMETRHEYIWQPFPEGAPFAERFNWALDMTTNFRFIGWNWSISAIPRPKIPSTTHIPYGTPVDMASIPIVTKAGYRRRLTQSDLIWSRLCTITLMYLTLDFLAVFMTKDPYFVLGPDHHLLELLPLPSYLRQLPPWALRAYRQAFSLAGVLAAISAVFNLNDLAQYFLAAHIFPERGELYQHTSTFGSPMQVLDRGLAGWWGGCWHQSFRVQFAAPARWLVRRGYLTRGSALSLVATLLVSFGQSGLLHASGSQTAVPRTKAWRSPVFFLLQVVGILLQYRVAATVKKILPDTRVPRGLSRTANVVFALAWLYMTADFFIDDMASAGIWLLEPVPFSFFRALGYGYPRDRWWRWDRNYFPRWYWGEHWWQSGIAL